MSNPSLLSLSKDRNNLFLYLAVSTTIISVALIQKKSKVQCPVYYVSQAFQGTGAKYPHMEKITFALIATSQKLHPYFQANLIQVMMEQPIRKVITNKQTRISRTNGTVGY